MKQLDEYLALQKEIYAYFGYEEGWRVIPIDDCRDMYWWVTGEGYRDDVFYSESPEDNEVYSDEIYTQRHLKKWVYAGAEYTMICVDTHTDGNQFLAIFDNAKHLTDRDGTLG